MNRTAAGLAPVEGRQLAWTSTSTQCHHGMVFSAHGRAVVIGSTLSMVPLVVAFLLLQRYWQSGLATGSVKQ